MGSVNNYDSCRYCITEEMFQSDIHRRIFRCISEMNAKGKTSTTPYDILMQYGDAVVDICADMADLVADYSFVHLKTTYNEIRYIAYHRDGIEPRYTDIRFEDYVVAFVKAYEDEERKESDIRTEAAAA